MPAYLITPKAPLLFRNGKPFGTGDNIADTLEFPQPTTIDGAMRTAWAEQQAGGFNYADKATDLLKKRVLGPLLVRTNVASQQHEVLFPAPDDALCLNTDDAGHRIFPKIPAATGAGEGTDIPETLLPVFLGTDDKSKPAKHAPRFWTREAMTSWLINEYSDIPVQQQIQRLPIETRTHVAIDPQTLSNVNSHLFQTSGLTFAQQCNPSVSGDPVSGWQPYEYGLLSWFKEDLDDTFRTVGGERRLSHIQAAPGVWPKCPKALQAAFMDFNPDIQGIRLILATPDYFQRGYLPDFLDHNLQGTIGNITLTLRAASIPRWQANTSWDMASNGKTTAKHSSKDGRGMRSVRRLVPAGSVYWFDVEGDVAEMQEHWLTPVYDHSECKREDGFGLILPGIWNKTQQSRR